MGTYGVYKKAEKKKIEREIHVIDVVIKIQQEFRVACLSDHTFAEDVNVYQTIFK